MLKVHGGKPYDRTCCENRVEALVNQQIVQHRPREHRIESEDEQGSRQKDVLVENVASCKRVSAIVLTTMDEKKILQKLKLSNSVIRSFGCLLSFKTANTDTDVSSNYHIDIVCPIADRKSVLIWVLLLDHVD